MLALTVLRDVPKANADGLLKPLYDEGMASAGAGLYLEIAGGLALALAGGLGLVKRAACSP